MNIIIIGAGEVGFYLAKILSEKDYNVTLIEKEIALAREIEEEINAKIINGNGALAKVLKEAKVELADYVFAMTTSDSVNLQACKVAKVLGTRYAIARIHHQTYSDCKIFNYELQFDVDYLINPEALCAIELAKSIRNPGRVAVESFARGEVEVQQIKMAPESKFNNLALKDLNLGNNFRIGYIQREEKIEVPTAETILEANDLITLIGPAQELYKLKPAFDPQLQVKSRYVTIYGGTETAIMLKSILNKTRFKIKIIEKDPDTCKLLAENFPDASIINADATSLKILEEEQVAQTDFFIACTGDDEDNIMTSIQAKRLGAKHVQLTINKHDYEFVLNDLQDILGIETAISPRNATVRELLRFINTESYVELATLPGNTAKIIEVTVPTNCEFQLKKICEIPWPKKAVIIGLLHKFRAKVPTAEDKILAGDKLIVIIEQNQIEDFIRLLQ